MFSYSPILNFVILLNILCTLYFFYFLKYPKKLKYTKDINNNFLKKCLEIFQNPLFILIFKSQVL